MGDRVKDPERLDRSGVISLHVTGHKFYFRRHGSGNGSDNDYIPADDRGCVEGVLRRAWHALPKASH